VERLNQWVLHLTNVAVLIGVVFLAYELQQTSEALSTEKTVATVQMYAQANEVLVSTEGLAEMIIRGDESYESLSPAEQLRYFSYKAIQLNALETHFFLLMDEEDEQGLAHLAAIAEWMLSTNGAKTWWQHDAVFSPELEAWIESQTGISPKP
jgi:hypothetical protein